MKFLKEKKIILQGIIFVILVVGIVLFSNTLADNDAALRFINTFGYIGVFVFAAVSGFNLLFPIPAIAFLPVLTEAGLNVGIAIVVIGIGMTIGDAVGFWIGTLGQKAIRLRKKEHKILDTLQNIQKKYPRAPLALLGLWAAFAPLPNELMVIPLAVMGYRFVSMMILLFFGNIVFNTFVAFGILHVVDLFI